MNYHQVRFKYRCQVCQTNDFKTVDEFPTEKYYPPIQIGNDTHNHDRNEGFVKLICCNDHQTTQDYISACECGWNLLVKYDPSKLYQEFEEKKRIKKEEYERGIANGTIISYDPCDPCKGLNIFQKILLYFALTFGK